MFITSLQETIVKHGNTSPELVGVLAGFRCNRNKEVQDFLHNNAISYNLCHRSRTYLCMGDNDELIGFFTLAIKDFEISETISRTKKKKLTYGLTEQKRVSAYLIAQVGKDDRATEKVGKGMINAALKLIKKAQDYVGGRVVYIECKPNDRLVKFYEDNGFARLQDNGDLVQLAQII